MKIEYVTSSLGIGTEIYPLKCKILHIINYKTLILGAVAYMNYSGNLSVVF